MKTKIFLLFAIFFSIQINVLSQIHQSYSLKKLDSNKTYVCSIDFCRNGFYFIELSDITSAEDISIGYCVSVGKYKIDNKTITLNDKVQGYKMLLYMDSNKLIMKKSFTWLINKEFIENGYYVDEKNTWISEIDKSNFKILKAKYKFFNQNKKIFSFDLGKYFNDLGLEIYFFDSNKYKYIYKDIILSEGTFKKDGNKLILWDKTIEYNFYLVVKDHELECKQMPLLFNGAIFKKR